MVTLPPNGSYIVFTKTPIGSYAKAGEVYQVTYAPRNPKAKRAYRPSVRLWCESRDCGTYDNAQMWSGAAWQVVARAED